jgi:hypothetical protein
LLSFAGCQLFRPNGVEIDLDQPGPIFVAAGTIADNQPPGLLSTFNTVDITSVTGMA